MHRVARPEPEPSRSMFGNDPYTVLGIRKDVTAQVIKKAYYRKVRQFSPELFPEEFKVVRKAYEALWNTERRARTDLLVPNEMDGVVQYRGIPSVAESLAKIEHRITELQPLVGQGIAPLHLKRELVELHKKKSLLLVSKQLWQEAIAEWNNILNLDEGDAETRHNLHLGWARMAYSYARHSCVKEAMDIWRKMLHEDPHNPLVVQNVAIAARELCEKDEEKRCWKELVAIWSKRLQENPSDAYLNALVLELHKLTGGEFMPVAGADGHVATVSDSKSFKQLAIACMEQHNWQRAIEAYEQYLQEDPNDLDSLHNQGWAYLNAGNPDRAFTAWNRALKVKPDNKEIKGSIVKGHIQVGDSFVQRGMLNPALVHYKNAINTDPTSSAAYLALGKIYLQRGDNSAAVDAWDKAQRFDPRNKEIPQLMKQARIKLR